jgi:hypothetical protein
MIDLLFKCEKFSYEVETILNEKNIFVFLNFFTKKFESQPNISILDITKFNIIYECIFAKILDLVENKKMSVKKLNELSEYLKKENLLKIFMKALRNKILKDETRLSEQFLFNIGALFEVF